MIRRHEFEGSFNFRDLGGWRTGDGATVRWGKLFRADSVHLMTEPDVTRARDELGVRTLIDLRGDLEISYGGLGSLAESVTARHHAPLSSRRTDVIDAQVAAAASADRSPDAMVEQYLGILDVSGGLVVDAVAAMASSDALPAVFFCAAGKDRTGVLSAVVLGALGVRDEDIVEDYVLTGETIDRIIGRFASRDTSPAFYRDLPPSHFAPYAETMERVIAHVRDTHGSFGNYLVSNGLPSASLDALAASLLERS
jgi:protein-tyrosine phosphatase